MTKVKRTFGFRRFTLSGRPDCFEVYRLDTKECASFPMYAYQADATARHWDGIHNKCAGVVTCHHARDVAGHVPNTHHERN